MQMGRFSIRGTVLAVLLFFCSVTTSWACSAVTGMSPTSGPATGGTVVTITGNGFQCHSVDVTFGGKPAASVSLVNDNTILATSPAGTGTVAVVVTLTAGSASVFNAGNFTYGAPADSLNIRDLQVVGTKTVATSSGDAITGAVGDAIGDAFSNGSTSPVVAGPNGVRFNFAAEARTDSRVDDAFKALGYAGNVYKAPPAPAMREWSAWADLRGTGFSRDNGTDVTRSDQVNFNIGLGRKIAPGILLGSFVGYESFHFNMPSAAGRLWGYGMTAGVYGGVQIDPRWRLDAMAGASSISYKATAGLAAGAFDATRWIGSAGVTGSLPASGLILEPSARAYVLVERDDAWTDNFGTSQDARSFSVGRVSAGGRVLAPWAAGGVRVTPYAGFYGDWRFSSDTALPVDVANTGIRDGWSGRATAGISAAAVNGVALSVGGELGGIGAGYEIWSVNGRASLPF